MTVVSFFFEQKTRVQLYFLTFEWENLAIFRFTFELYGNSLDRFSAPNLLYSDLLKFQYRNNP